LGRGCPRWRPPSGACSTKGERSGPLPRTPGRRRTVAHAASPEWNDATSSLTEEFFEHRSRTKAESYPRTRTRVKRAPRPSGRPAQCHRSHQDGLAASRGFETAALARLGISNQQSRVFGCGLWSLLTLCEKFHIIIGVPFTVMGGRRRADVRTPSLSANAPVSSRLLRNAARASRR
jgi:hypothetical protein